MMDWYDQGGMNGSWMVFMWIFWVIIIGLGIWFVTRLTQGDKTSISRRRRAKFWIDDLLQVKLTPVIMLKLDV